MSFHSNFSIEIRKIRFPRHSVGDSSLDTLIQMFRERNKRWCKKKTFSVQYTLLFVDTHKWNNEKKKQLTTWKCTDNQNIIGSNNKESSMRYTHRAFRNENDGKRNREKKISTERIFFHWTEWKRSDFVGAATFFSHFVLSSLVCNSLQRRLCD